VELSPWLGPIRPGELQAALARFGLGTLLGVESTGIGLGGQTSFVSATTGEYVLRGKPLFVGQIARERFFVEFLHERVALTVPWPYYYDPSCDIFGWQYAIMPRLPGRWVPDVAAIPSRTEREAIAAALGRGLAVVHDATWPVPGEYDFAEDTIRPMSVPYAEWLTQRVRGMVDRIVREDATVTRADQAWVYALLQEADPAVQEPFQPAFVMHDYHNNNVVFSHDDGVWEVCGVFDLSEGYIGDPEADLARPTRGLFLIDPALAGAFLREYLRHRPARGGFLARFAVYMLDDLLISWSYARRMGWRDPSRGLRELCEPLTSAVETVLS
jgi:hygromycin-B 7''-O-kinase